MGRRICVATIALGSILFGVMLSWFVVRHEVLPSLGTAKLLGLLGLLVLPIVVGVAWYIERRVHSERPAARRLSVAPGPAAEVVGPVEVAVTMLVQPPSTGPAAVDGTPSITGVLVEAPRDAKPKARPGDDATIRASSRASVFARDPKRRYLHRARRSLARRSEEQ